MPRSGQHIAGDAVVGKSAADRGRHSDRFQVGFDGAGDPGRDEGVSQAVLISDCLLDNLRRSFLLDDDGSSRNAEFCFDDDIGHPVRTRGARPASRRPRSRSATHQPRSRHSAR